MNPWTGALLITVAGAAGGVINALLTDKGFILPRRMRGSWCPGFLSNVLIGGFSAFFSWAMYGSGAGIDLAQATARAEISLRFSALGGAFLIGVAGARWITNEADKTLLKEGIKIAATKTIPPEYCERLVQGPAG